jgi:ADP-heptose:LPS heptosyltransferase
MHPGSGGKKKRWDPEGFQKVARWWQEQRKGKVLLLLGPAEEQEIGQWRTVGEVAARLSVWQVAAIVSRADFYIGNDSGVSHLAGAVGARGVVLFGPTRPRQWRPLGGSLSVLQNFEYRRAFPTKEGISFDEMTDDEVIAKLTAQGG